MRTPVPDARSAASPRRSVPASGSSSQRTSYSASWTAIARAADRSIDGGRVAGHPPALVEVDHDRHRIADGVPGRRHGGEALLEPSRIDPDLERAEPLVAQAQGRFGPGGRGQQHPARGIGRDAVAGATEERGDREPGDLADDVPQRDLDRPVAAGVEVDRLEDADVVRDRQRIAADEQVLEGLEAVHRVARSDADDALVGLDPDDRRRERAARDGVPGGREGRVEGQDQTVQADAGDAHVGSIAQSSTRTRQRPRLRPGFVDSGEGRQYRSETLRRSAGGNRSRTGSHIANCANAVTQEVGALPDVTDVHVEVVSGDLTVTSTRPLTDDEVSTAIHEAGYDLAS